MMNERIKELAEQAGLEPCIIFKNYATSEKSITIEQSKFADLIVEECAEQVKNLRVNDYGISGAEIIREHFGVEV